MNERLVTGETALKQTRIEEVVREDSKKVIGAASLRRRQPFVPVPLLKKKVSSSKKKETHQKSAVQVLGERSER